MFVVRQSGSGGGWHCCWVFFVRQGRASSGLIGGIVDSVSIFCGRGSILFIGKDGG